MNARSVRFCHEFFPAYGTNKLFAWARIRSFSWQILVVLCAAILVWILVTWLR